MITEVQETAVACRYVEEELAAAIRRGATQFVAIGRSCDIPERGLPRDVRVLAMQAGDTGLAAEEITFVSWLGGRKATPGAIVATLRLIGSLPPSSELLFDYRIRSGQTDGEHSTAMDGLASQMDHSRCRHIDPQALQTLLRASGFRQIEEIQADSADGRRLIRALT